MGEGRLSLLLPHANSGVDRVFSAKWGVVQAMHGGPEIGEDLGSPCMGLSIPTHVAGERRRGKTGSARRNPRVPTCNCPFGLLPVIFRSSSLLQKCPLGRGGVAPGGLRWWNGRWPELGFWAEIPTISLFLGDPWLLYEASLLLLRPRPKLPRCTFSLSLSSM